MCIVHQTRVYIRKFLVSSDLSGLIFIDIICIYIYVKGVFVCVCGGGGSGEVNENETDKIETEIMHRIILI